MTPIFPREPASMEYFIKDYYGHLHHNLNREESKGMSYRIILKNIPQGLNTCGKNIFIIPCQISSLLHPLSDGHFLSSSYITGISNSTFTGFPFNIPGENFVFMTASRAATSHPNPIPFAI